MATNTEVAGISIGITADIGGLDASLTRATSKIDNWKRRTAGKSVDITVNAKRGDSWNSIEGDLKAIVEKVTKGYEIPVNIELGIDPTAEKARLEGIIKGAIKNLKVPIEIDYKANAHVEVTWSWADGHGPPGPGGTVGGNQPPPQPKSGGPKKKTVTADDEVTTQADEPPASKVVPPKKKSRAPKSKVTAQPVPQAEPEAETAQVSGIAAMGTATPKNRAQKARAETIAANTAAMVEETGKALQEWRAVTRATMMKHGQMTVPGQQNIRGFEVPRGATGFESEYVSGKPTGNVRYTRPEGGRRAFFRTRTPRTFEGTTHGERPTEGIVYEARRGDPNDPRRGLADPRTMSWFDPGGGFDPEVRRHSKDLFDKEMAKREDAIWSQVSEVLEPRMRPGETAEDAKQRALRDWTYSWGGQEPQARSAQSIKNYASALTMSPAMESLDKLRMAGDFGNFFGALPGEEGDPGALAYRATAMSGIRAAAVAREQKALGRPLEEKERKAALSKGTARARKLRQGNALPEKDRPEEIAYVQLTALIGQAYVDQTNAEKDLQAKQSQAQGADTRHHNAAVKAFSEMHGARPRYEPEPGAPLDTLGPEDWDSLFRDFEADFKAPPPKKRERGPLVNAATVQGTDYQEQIKSWAAEMDRLVESENPDAGRIAELEALLRAAGAGADDILGGAARGSTKARGLTGAHRRASEEIRGNTGFCQYCGTAFRGKERGHADHATARARGGDVESLTSACSVCNTLKGDRGLLQFLQDPTRRKGPRSVDPVQARARMGKRFPKRMWDDRLNLAALREASDNPLEGSARSRSDLEGLGGIPQELPDIRDLAEAMGMGRAGPRNRTRLSPGSLTRMKRAIASSGIEKVFALMGDRYIDAAGRVLVDVREVMELETDPKKTSAKGFSVTRAGQRKLRERAERLGMGVQGFVHGARGHGRGLSTPADKAAGAPVDDVTALQNLDKIIPGILSGVYDPEGREGLELFGMGAGGPVKRAYKVKRALPRMRVEPAQAQAASPLHVETMEDMEAFWGQLPDESRQHLVTNAAAAGIPLPPFMQAWANAQATGQAPGAPPSRPGAPPGAQHWGSFAAAPPPPAVAGPWGRFAMAAMGGGPGGSGPRGGGPRMFGGPPAAPPTPPPPAGPAGSPPGAFVPGGGPAPGTVGRYQQSTRAIREQALQAGIPYNYLTSLESPHETEAAGRREFLTRVQGQIQEDIAKTPVRAFTTAIGQYASNLVVRGQVGEERIRAGRFGRIAERATSQAEESGINRDLLQSQLDFAKQASTPNPDLIAELEGQVAFETERHENAGKAADFFAQKFQEAGKKVAPIGVQMLNLATITGSMIGAGIAFQVGMQVASAAMDMLANATMDGVEASTGYNDTLKRVQAALAEQATTTGDIRGTVAGGFMQAGMEPSDRVRGLLEGQVGAVVATNRFAAQRDLLRTAENLSAQAPMAREFGIAPGLVRPTGGLFGTVIGAQQSLDEVIGNELERLNPGGEAGLWNDLNSRMLPFDMVGKDFDPGNIEWFPLTEEAKAREKAQLEFADNLNAELEQVGNTAQFGVGRGDAARFDEGTRAQADALDDLGANEIAAAVRAGSYEIRDANGALVTEVEDIAKIVNDLGEALAMPSGAEFLKANEKNIEASLIGIQDAYRTSIQDSQVGFFRNWAVNRPLPFGTSFNTGDAASQAAMARFGPGAQDAEMSIRWQAFQGRQQAVALGADPATLNRLTAAGDDIASARSAMASEQLRVSSIDYAHQLKVAERTLSDLIGLTGQLNQGQASAVGLAEKENLALERRNTVLGREIQARGLLMQQRQINYNLAVAGFSVGGESGAEAFARMEMAKKEQEFAQLDLNAQNEMFQNQGTQIENQIQIVDTQNLRALEDASHALLMLSENHNLEKFVAAGNDFITLKEQEIAGLEAEVDAQINRGRSVRDLELEIAREMFKATGEYMLDEVVDPISAAFEQMQEDYEGWLEGVGTPWFLGDHPDEGMESEGRGPGGGAPRTEDARPGEGHGFASGALFNTSGATGMIVGEAGRETVAVLRNPRMWSGDGGGGGGATIININNPVVRDNSDIEAIARTVENVLSQRAMLVRPR